MWKWGALLLAVVALGVGGYYGYWAIRAERQASQLEESERAGEAALRPPKSLTSEYDPSESSAVFGVTKFDGESGRATLVYKWPEARAGQSIESQVVCQDWLISVQEPGASVPRLVSRQGLYNVMSQTPLERLILTGKCEDARCARLVSACQLTIKAERRGDGV